MSTPGPGLSGPSSSRSSAGIGRVDVFTAGGSYPVLVRAGILNEVPHQLALHAPAARHVIISDDTVAELYGGALRARLEESGARTDLFTFPPGEGSKSRENWAELTDRLLGAGVGRDACVIALGGGVTGDLAGFVAATYMRGIPIVQIPTTVLAMVDASVGGKSGVDVPAGKNLVGAFHPPRLVIVDPEVGGSLSRRERSRGIAEVVKHGAILDADHLDRLESLAPSLLEGVAEAIEGVVLHSIALKAGVVGRDEREGGIRRILNFGHTVGHALEAATAYSLGHGEAVAMGMIVEAEIGERIGVTEAGTAGRLSVLLERMDLPVHLPPGIPLRRVLAFMKSDKKGVSGEPRFVLLARPGEVDPGSEWLHQVPETIVEEALRTASPSSSA